MLRVPSAGVLHARFGKSEEIMNRLSRRTFIKSATLAVVAPLVVPAAVLGREGRTAPSERIGMALIGSGGQGRGDMGGMMGFNEVRFFAVCDPVPEHRAEAKQQVNSRYQNNDCTEYADFREVLELPGLDAILIATPDHWHSPMTVAAAKKGLDVYCEKPETLTVVEGRKMANAVKKYGIVFSGGSQVAFGNINTGNGKTPPGKFRAYPAETAAQIENFWGMSLC